MSLFFPEEFATSVDAKDGYVIITQYGDNDCVDVIGQVRLTEHQFMEIYNREKYIITLLRDRGDE